MTGQSAGQGAQAKTSEGIGKGKGLSSGTVLALGFAAGAPGANIGEPGQVRLTPVDPL